MAEALMRQCVAGRGESASISSAGLLAPDHPCPPEIVAMMAEIGLDLSEHRSRRLTEELIEPADLVLTMERQHLREVSVMVPAAWERTFTLKEIVRRGAEIGWRSGRQPLEQWLVRLHAERETADLLGTSSTDDVADPHGGTPEQYAATKLELQSLIGELAELIWPDEAAQLGFASGGAVEPDAAPVPEPGGRRPRLGLSRRR
jgi:protein-tyrosine-phosphatase